MLDVESLGIPADVRCQHQCSAGCAIYENRPQVCSGFTCAWREGMLGPHDRPDKTHVVIWLTQLGAETGGTLDVLQANIAKGKKWHKKTIRWLVNRSHTIPVTLVQGPMNELWQDGEKIIEWHTRDFIKLGFDDSGRKIERARLVKRAEALRSKEARKAWRDQVLDVTQLEDDPELAAKQMEYLKGKADAWLGDDE